MNAETIKLLRELCGDVDREPTYLAQERLADALFDNRAALLAAAAEAEGWRMLRDAAAELLEVADLRGDSDLPHPANDPKTWTARMQTAWNELRAALARAALDKEMA